MLNNVRIKIGDGANNADVAKVSWWGTTGDGARTPSAPPLATWPPRQDKPHE